MYFNLHLFINRNWEALEDPNTNVRVGKRGRDEALVARVVVRQPRAYFFELGFDAAARQIHRPSERTFQLWNEQLDDPVNEWSSEDPAMTGHSGKNGTHKIIVFSF